MKIGIIKEGKTPPDTRVALNPTQCAQILKQYPNVEIVVEPSPNRCYTDEEYRQAGISISDDLSACEVLLGVKEVPIEQLRADKTYFFFSHTIKEQPYNRGLLQAILAKNIRLLDYEVLTNSDGQRVIAFGRFAGIAGAHNGMMTYGNSTGSFNLPQMIDFKDFEEAIAYYKTLTLPAMKIVLTGTGRVANGAAEVLDFMGIRKVSPTEYLNQDFSTAVYTQLDCEDYVEKTIPTALWQEYEDNKHKGMPNPRGAFDLQDFFSNPENYQSKFLPYTRCSDLMINGIYWDNKAPQFFTKEEMAQPEFKIKVIADVTCDIAPVASIPSTLYATTIAEPVFGYDPMKELAVAAYQDHTVDMMTIDNLPNELPRDASQAFGEQFMEHVLEELLGLKDTGMIERASIAVNGQLGPCFGYLQDYVNQMAE